MYDSLVKQFYGVNELKHNFDHDSSKLKVPDLSEKDDKKVWSTRIRISRNVKDIGHTLTENQVEKLKELRDKAKLALTHLPPIQTTHAYDAYFTNDAETIQYDTKMIWYREYAWFLSEEDGTIFKAAGCNQNFPDGRSLHYNGHRTILTYINDEDHIKISCHDHGLNLKKHYDQI
mgnify:FL=1